MTTQHGDPRSIYCDALAIEFQLRGIPFVRQVACQLQYKGHLLTGHHRIDLVCFDGVLVEVKAISSVGPAEDAQVLNYLALSGNRIGLLVNFGERSLLHKRFILDRRTGWLVLLTEQAMKHLCLICV